MQSITTQFLCPTNHRPSRYKATTSSGLTLTLEANHALDLEANHVRVARALILKLGWFHTPDRGDRYGAWHFGGAPGGGYVFVCAVEDARVARPSDAPSEVSRASL